MSFLSNFTYSKLMQTSNNALTYKQLLHQLLDLTPEQLDCTPTVYDSETDEYLPIKQFLIATDEDQVLDEAHPFFSLS